MRSTGGHTHKRTKGGAEACTEEVMTTRRNVAAVVGSVGSLFELCVVSLVDGTSAPTGPDVLHVVYTPPPSPLILFHAAIMGLNKRDRGRGSATARLGRDVRKRAADVMRKWRLTNDRTLPLLAALTNATASLQGEGLDVFELDLRCSLVLALSPPSYVDDDVQLLWSDFLLRVALCCQHSPECLSRRGLSRITDLWGGAAHARITGISVRNLKTECVARASFAFVII